jgi:hypothetical protein
MPPKGSELKAKTAKDKTYNWCNNHQLWVLCKPSKCHLKKEKEKCGKNKKEKKKELKTKVYKAAFTSDFDSEEDAKDENTQSEESCDSDTSE